MFTRKVAICAALIGVTAFAFASIGGGGKNSKTQRIAPGYKPIKTATGFTLKSGPTYRGTLIMNEDKTRNPLALNSLVTYRSGNVTYILPHRYKMATNCQQERKSNLQLLNLKIKLGK